MKLIVEPDNGMMPVLAAIRHAKRALDILIFRLDIRETFDALAGAVRRGVNVRALIAHTNRGGEKRLRKLEKALLDAGVTVSRTADDLVRYHGKLMVVDHQILHVYGFNFTRLDTRQSRSFGVITRNRRLVDEARKLFEADCARQPYSPGCDRFVVSPENARDRLAAFLSGARKQLLIYDPKISDPGMLSILDERARSGVDVRILGKLGGKVGDKLGGKLGGKLEGSSLAVEPNSGKRLHVRAIVRDGNRAFVGSQSLRRLELEKRREIGVIVDDRTVVRGILRIFEQDWAQTSTGRKSAEGQQPRADDKPPKEPSPEPTTAQAPSTNGQRRA